jgi:hypothetical protein
VPSAQSFLRISRNPLPSRRPGSTLPIVVMLLVMFVGMLAFAIDVGYIAHARTEL